MKPIQKKAVVLLSGGLDSATCLAIARSQGFESYCLSFNYGQRHCAELAAAEVLHTGVPVVSESVPGIEVTEFSVSELPLHPTVEQIREELLAIRELLMA